MWKTIRWNIHVLHAIKTQLISSAFAVSIKSMKPVQVPSQIILITLTYRNKDSLTLTTTNVEIEDNCLKQIDPDCSINNAKVTVVVADEDFEPK